MKRFLSSFIVLGAAMVLASTAFGQAAGPRGGGRWFGQGPGNRAEMRKRTLEIRNGILAQLGLNAGQKAKIKALDAKTDKSFKDLIKPGEKPTPETRDKLRAIMKSQRDEMEKILTPAQWKKYRELMKAKREEMRKKREGIKP